MKNPLLGIALVILLYSCKDTTEDPADDPDAASFYRYFPLDSGSFVIYQVDSVIHEFIDDNTNNPDSVVTEYSYQVMEQIDSSYLDGEGDQAWRISRYYRTDSASAWSFTSVWSAKRLNNSAQKVEENIRYIKLSFPVKLNKSWNGNLYNFFPEEDYTYTEVNEPLSLSNLEFDSSLTVVQLEDFNLIHRIFKQEKYATGVGLIYSERDSLNINALGNITNGFEFRQQVIGYSPH